MNIISKPISALVALVLFSKIAAAAQADEFYNGLWASERRFCDTEGEDAPFEITRKEMFFMSTCAE